ncbi:hypothetical protein BASA81_000496 [Batrachochytrium salamandrivorans]|nr:hypothetical protein BASA81_000496 [Batrachochytrium salamandrivorans]
MALARRHVLPAINEPQYEINDVPRAKYTGQNSTSKFVSKRDEWLAMLGEAVLTSNRAEEDFERKLRENGDLVLHPGKPLSLEYLADRIDTDDPLWGYTVRTTQEGWMQGYITLTTFTTWLKWFRFDSLCEAASVLPYARTLPGTDDKVQKWWDDRVMDGDGRLARALNRQIRDGDWTDEGVIWPRVAEVSLLAGLGCGGLLLDAALEELYDKRDSAGDRQYEYVVVQATENAVPFYESRGFIRVGAIARYEERGTDAVVPTIPEDDEDEVYGKKSKKAKRSKAPSRSLPVQTPVLKQDDVESDEEELTGTWSPITHVKSIEGDTPKRIAKRLPGVRASDVVFLNRRIFGDELHEDALLIPGTLMRIPVVSKFDQKLYQAGTLSPVEPLRMKVGELREVCCASSQHVPGTQSGMWYSTLHEGIPMLSRKLGVSSSELVALNKTRYPELKTDSNLHPGSMLLLPGKTVDLQSVYALAGATAAAGGGGKKDNVTKDEIERRKEEQRLIREESKDESIRDFYCATTTANSTSMEGMLTKRLSDVMAYRHWTFPDEPAKLTSPSYMMAMPLNKRYLDKYVPSFQSGQSAFQQLKQMSTRECLNFPHFDYRVEGETCVVTTTPTPELPHGLEEKEEMIPMEEMMDNVPSSEDAVFRESTLQIRVAIKTKAVERWRTLVGEVKKENGGLLLFCKGGNRTRRVDAVLSRPLKPRPPVAPIIPLAPLREYVRQVRPDVMREYPHLTCGEAVRVCETSWKQLDEEDRQVYTKLASEQRDEYRIRMRQYLVDLARYHKQFGLDNKLYDLTDPDHPVLRSAAASALVTPLLKKLKHTGTTGGDHNVQQMLSVDALGPGYRKLMNKVVTLKPKTNEEFRKRWVESKGKEYHHSTAEYYYTLTYIPDLQWCRLVPLKRCGQFQRGASRKKDYDRHVGRVKWMLAPESEGGEIDVSAERCIPVWKAYSTKNVQDADKEEWDVYDTDPKLNGLNLNRTSGYYGGGLEEGLTPPPPVELMTLPVFEFEPAPPMLLPPMD